jgi:hypothetical protein
MTYSELRLLKEAARALSAGAHDEAARLIQLLTENAQRALAAQRPYGYLGGE